MMPDTERAAPAEPEPGEEVIRVQDVELDRAARRVRVRGRLFDLPPKEYELLEALMLNAGRAIERDVLLRQLWADPFRGDHKTVDVHILRLRRKIEVDRARPTHIRTLRGFGYIFDVEPTVPSQHDPIG
jgi:DNA-binding response OmpR family regulator